jgi:hypothetical protein
LSIEFEKVFIVNKRNVISTYVVYNKDGEECIQGYDNNYILLDRSRVYEDINEARYASFIYQMEHGGKLENFKRSPYFKYYYDRAKTENPEFLI